MHGDWHSWVMFFLLIGMVLLAITHGREQDAADKKRKRDIEEQKAQTLSNITLATEGFMAVIAMLSIRKIPVDIRAKWFSTLFGGGYCPYTKTQCRMLETTFLSKSEATFELRNLNPNDNDADSQIGFYGYLEMEFTPYAVTVLQAYELVELVSHSWGTADPTTISIAKGARNSDFHRYSATIRLTEKGNQIAIALCQIGSTMKANQFSKPKAEYLSMHFEALGRELWEFKQLGTKCDDADVVTNCDFLKEKMDYLIRYWSLSDNLTIEFPTENYQTILSELKTEQAKLIEN